LNCFSSGFHGRVKIFDWSGNRFAQGERALVVDGFVYFREGRRYFRVADKEQSAWRDEAFNYGNGF
jgi:hypothetical protein